VRRHAKGPRHRLGRIDRFRVGPLLREQSYEVIGVENDMRSRFLGLEASAAGMSEFTPPPSHRTTGPRATGMRARVAALHESRATFTI
jgi:hypothetical protein